MAECLKELFPGEDFMDLDNNTALDDCYTRRAGENVKPDYKPASGINVTYRRRFCACEEDHCNAGAIPGIEDTETEFVKCYECVGSIDSPKDSPTFGPCKTPDKDETRTKWCPYGPCSREVYVFNDPTSGNEPKITRGCSAGFDFTGLANLALCLSQQHNSGLEVCFYELKKLEFF